MPYKAKETKAKWQREYMRSYRKTHRKTHSKTQTTNSVRPKANQRSIQSPDLAHQFVVPLTKEQQCSDKGFNA